MKRILLAVIVLILSNILLGQENRLTFPNVWFKTNICEENILKWKNSFYGDEFIISSEQIGDDFIGQMNYNKSLLIDGSFTVFIDSVNFTSKDVTVMFVHHVKDSLNAKALWQLNSPTGDKLSLSTQKIDYGNGNIEYEEKNNTEIVVTSLSISWKEDSLGVGNIVICGNDSLSFNGMFSEFIFFDMPLLDSTQQIWVSYLAVKNGVTLFQTDYLNSFGEKIWDYEMCKKYSHKILALGRDDIFGLNQKQSRTCNDMLGIGLGEYSESNETNDIILPEDNYIFIGCDTFLLNKKQELLLENNFNMTKYGNSLVCIYGNEINSIPGYIRVNVSEWEGDRERFHLFIDRSGTGNFNSSELEYYPSSQIDSTGIIHFSNIYWDSDGNGKDMICFGYLTTDSIINQELVYGTNPEIILENLEGLQGISDLRSASKDFTENIDNNTYLIFPNPSKGVFNLEIKYEEATDVEVKIYSPDGRVVSHMKDTGKSYYLFEENIKMSGQYLIEINSLHEKRNLKLIIN